MLDAYHLGSVLQLGNNHRLTYSLVTFLSDSDTFTVLPAQNLKDPGDQELVELLSEDRFLRIQLRRSQRSHPIFYGFSTTDNPPPCPTSLGYD